MKKQFWKKLRADTCTNCMSERAIECYDEYDNPIRYSFLLDKIEQNKDISNIINSRAFTIMKCQKCGKIYCIDWRLGFPVPLTYSEQLDNFLFEFYSNNNIL